LLSIRPAGRSASRSSTSRHLRSVIYSLTPSCFFLEGWPALVVWGSLRIAARQANSDQQGFI